MQQSGDQVQSVALTVSTLRQGAPAASGQYGIAPLIVLAAAATFWAKGIDKRLRLALRNQLTLPYVKDFGLNAMTSALAYVAIPFLVSSLVVLAGQRSSHRRGSLYNARVGHFEVWHHRGTTLRSDDVAGCLALALRRQQANLVERAIRIELATDQNLPTPIEPNCFVGLLEEFIAAVLTGAQASRVLITAARREDRLCVTWIYDGMGYESASRNEALEGLIEKLALHEGRVDMDVGVDSEKVTVSFHIPQRFRAPIRQSEIQPLPASGQVAGPHLLPATSATSSSPATNAGAKN